ncbi:GNAT family N-acetyltransferase [Candidatus Pacearchaeota archaeon]|nr:GNAT family N-acetyltransferase [Candidatus Pacearchaeota archaeon]PIN71120.1 MAG: hypothetical protein COV77_03665 [Candidatus Pacearchaeota archaeon CG11_big_fil_rev_8_21_14_0_20_30_13]PIZ82155.1 MAG: hypothetical protein COX98_00895 [Candidatus Pacearchaeota archaeon CG_4_10_14_0_2_um_filter_30_11]PJA71316.1 MAG: hypothetical protein CO153_02200 [Candidatus Pacearchaeota archaeon CG_4_9_14_3_um_filter_30_11]
MKIKIKLYDKKYFLKYIYNLLNFKTLKSMGIFNKRFVNNFFKNIFLRKKDKKESYLFMILSDGKIVGGLDLTQLSGRNFNVGAFIFKEYRNQGIAEKAIRKLFVFAKKKKVKKISGINDLNNLASIKLVIKLGYKKIKEEKGEIFWEKILK